VSYAELIEFCNQHMAYYMVPRYLSFAEELPKTPSEKVEKYKLKIAATENRHQLWDRESAGIRVRR
jgi:carnitine-CoA ligase